MLQNPRRQSVQITLIISWNPSTHISRICASLSLHMQWGSADTPPLSLRLPQPMPLPLPLSLAPISDLTPTPTCPAPSLLLPAPCPLSLPLPPLLQRPRRPKSVFCGSSGLKAELKYEQKKILTTGGTIKSCAALVNSTKDNHFTIIKQRYRMNFAKHNHFHIIK